LGLASRQLAEKSSGWHHERLVTVEAIGFLKGQAHHHLQGVASLGLFLEEPERRRKGGIAQLHLESLQS
jgi:hypothetical protein